MGVTVKVQRGGEEVVWAGSKHLDWPFEDRDFDEAVEMAVERTLDEVQEWVQIDSTEQWPAKADAESWATLEDDMIRMGYGSLELRTISMTELGDAPAPS